MEHTKAYYESRSNTLESFLHNTLMYLKKRGVSYKRICEETGLSDEAFKVLGMPASPYKRFGDMTEGDYVIFGAVNPETGYYEEHLLKVAHAFHNGELSELQGDDLTVPLGEDENGVIYRPAVVTESNFYRGADEADIITKKRGEL